MDNSTRRALKIKRKARLECVMRVHREAAGMSQVQVAAACQVTPQTVSEWELGRSGITVARLKAYADAIGADAAEMLALST